MTKLSRFAATAALALVVALGAALPSGTAAAKMRIAFGDIETVETLNFLIAIERTKERGVDVEVTFFKSEDVASQAVVGGQADIGVGTPYALLQKVEAPIRMFYQLSTLRFFPVVNTEHYKSWKDLDGQEIAVHSRGSGTEAIMNLMAQRHGIEYSNMSYVPGSEVRAGAMLKGNIKATIVDSANKNILLDRGGDKFMVLPMEGIDATDEALYANTAFLSDNEEGVTVLVEEMLRTWREINETPGVVADLRARYNLAEDLPSDLEAELVPYYEEAVAVGMFPNNGGSRAAVKDDFEFYSVAGQLKGDPASLKVDDFWDFGPLDRALDNVGRM